MQQQLQSATDDKCAVSFFKLKQLHMVVSRENVFREEEHYTPTPQRDFRYGLRADKGTRVDVSYAVTGGGFVEPRDLGALKARFEEILTQGKERKLTEKSKERELKTLSKIFRKLVLEEGFARIDARTRALVREEVCSEACRTCAYTLLMSLARTPNGFAVSKLPWQIIWWICGGRLRYMRCGSQDPRYRHYVGGAHDPEYVAAVLRHHQEITELVSADFCVKVPDGGAQAHPLFVRQLKRAMEDIVN